MAHDLVALLGPDGVARTADLGRVVDRHSIGGWVAAPRLLRPYPGVVVLPERMEEWRTCASPPCTGPTASSATRPR
ncbi:hypothetical protein [Geodermatophilus siccatus]|uniref:hypothetical protein n=1 Tax=Geodermatophilus siccatus TaxID=1137991 RepID=UPI0011133DB9|nr:hypothetical protein [Geodermatophilus siccatus]